MAKSKPRKIEKFNLRPGSVLSGKYTVLQKLGGGWEGEVYRVVEKRTDIHRAAKLFYPHRNLRDKAVKFYARKLDRLRDCPIVIHYIHSEEVEVQGQPITCLFSEFVEGKLLCNFVKQYPGKRMRPFEALHLLYALAHGLEQVHAVKEYHGDLHDGNVMVRRQGIFFDVKLVDFYHWGAPTKAHLSEDVIDLIRLLYDAIGGKKWYAKQPPEIKNICRGLRRDLIVKQFPTAARLREHLERFAWDG